MRMLDNVVDINFYPTKESENANMRHRPVGLGSMGWHDVFYALDIDYSSEEAVALSDKIYENILPPLRILNENERKDLLNRLKSLNFTIKSRMAA